MGLRVKPPSAVWAHRHVHHFLLPPFRAVVTCHRWKPLLMYLYWSDAAALFMLLWYCLFSISAGALWPLSLAGSLQCSLMCVSVLHGARWWPIH